jgi:hypothetical protein
MSHSSASGLSLTASQSNSPQSTSWSARTKSDGGRYAQCGFSPSFLPWAVATTVLAFGLDFVRFLELVFLSVGAGGGVEDREPDEEADEEDIFGKAECGCGDFDKLQALSISWLFLRPFSRCGSRILSTLSARKEVR